MDQAVEESFGGQFELQPFCGTRTPGNVDCEFRCFTENAPDSVAGQKATSEYSRLAEMTMIKASKINQEAFHVANPSMRSSGGDTSTPETRAILDRDREKIAEKLEVVTEELEVLRRRTGAEADEQFGEVRASQRIRSQDSAKPLKPVTVQALKNTSKSDV